MESLKLKQYAPGEFPIEGDDLGILLKDRTLFHGSVNPNTERFMTAEEANSADITDGATVGSGLYLTSSPDAASTYASRRVRNASKKDDLVATSYEVNIDDMKLLDLRAQENITNFAEKFRTYLVGLIKDPTSKKRDYMVNNSIIAALQQIEKGATLQNIHSLTGYAMAGVFTDFVKELGYDGVVTIEGGEGHDSDDGFYIGNHDTYVLFDPSKAAIVSKTQV
jgi:hypothetical protein